MQRMQCGVLDARVSEAWKWRFAPDCGSAYPAISRFRVQPRGLPRNDGETFVGHRLQTPVPLRKT